MTDLLNWKVGDELPKPGELFRFNDQIYYWEPCPCTNPTCKRPFAYTKDGKKDHPMTTRLRAFNQGDQIDNILAKWLGVEALAQLQENGGNQAEAFFAMQAEVAPEGNVNNNALAKRGITRAEYDLAVEQADALMDLALLQILSSLGGDSPAGGIFGFGEDSSLDDLLN